MYVYFIFLSRVYGYLVGYQVFTATIKELF